MPVPIPLTTADAACGAFMYWNEPPVTVVVEGARRIEMAALPPLPV
jgi:hypothetical protein